MNLTNFFLLFCATPVVANPVCAMPIENHAPFNYSADFADAECPKFAVMHDGLCYAPFNYSADFADAKCPKFAVMHDGWCYATMDKSPHDSKIGDDTCDRTCQDEPLRLKAGWGLVKYSADVVAAVVAQNNFCTHVVVFDGGRGFGGKDFAGGAGKERRWVPDASGNEHALWHSPADARVLRVNACSRKVLMRALPAELRGLAATAALLLRHGLHAHYETLAEAGHVRYPKELLLLDDAELDELGIRMVARKKFRAMCAQLTRSTRSSTNC